jgi:hypothetical protein
MILVVLWALSLLLAMVPDVDLPLLGRVIRTPAGALPGGHTYLGPNALAALIGSLSCSSSPC